MDSGSTDGMTHRINQWDSISFVVAVSLVLVKNCVFLSKTWMNCLNTDSTLQIQSQWGTCHWYLLKVTKNLCRNNENNMKKLIGLV